MAEDIRRLFEPRAVAIVGASRNPAKIGHKLVDNILASGYKGSVYPVNPSGGTVLDLPAVPSIDAIDDDVDLACIAIPAKFAGEAVRACADRGVPYVAVIPSGFAEVGALAEEREMVAYAAERGTRILGPNIFGIYSAACSMNATFGPRDIQAGNIAIITQSGALGIAMMGKTRAENIGVSAVVSVGNKADIAEADLLSYLADDPATKAILMYVEGIQDGERLVRELREVTPRKPVLVIKSGRSRRGALAAASHTGSLAGADEVFSDVMRQCGVLRVDTIAEALNLSKFLATSPRPRGSNAVIITNGGGIGVMAADAAERFGVGLYDDLATLNETFSDAVPAFGSTRNPVDITGQGTVDDYRRSLDAALASEDIHSVICLGCETALLEPEPLTRTLESVAQRAASDTPVVMSFLGGAAMDVVVEELRPRGVPIYGDVYEAVSALGALYAYERRPATMTAPETPADIDGAAIREVVDSARAEERGFLLAHETRALAIAAGIRPPASAVASSMQDAVRHAEAIGYPVVLKVVSRHILHKSDVGGIALDLEDRGELIAAYEAILHRCRQAVPHAVIDGIEVSEMVRSGTETIVGARRDPSFGPVVMCGLGGVYVEVMKDVAFRAYPLDRAEALTMIKEVRSYPLLLGVRGESRKDVEAVVDAVLRVGAVLAANPDISDIEINPLVVYDEGEGTRAVDVRVILDDPGSGGDA
ncbi:CoA-binding protein [Candidatus Poribacteria bacterium]|nr:CoA-binding protein [Candidatus Poribacteria bacterium]